MRQTIKEIQVNIAYSWYIGYGFDEQIFSMKFLNKFLMKLLNVTFLMKKNDIKRIKVSKTDSECGVFHKGEHKKIFAYSANTACDKNNFVLGFVSLSKVISGISPLSVLTITSVVLFKVIYSPPGNICTSLVSRSIVYLWKVY